MKFKVAISQNTMVSIKSTVVPREAESFEYITYDGINVNTVYTSGSLLTIPCLDALPGSPPYTRGAYSTMYTAKPWTIRQYAGFSTAAKSNEFYRRALNTGLQGISVAFDLATHRGYDSDHPAVVGDVGKAGVAIDSVEDMKELFHGIDLTKISVSMTMNGAVLPVMACYIVAAMENGYDLEKLSGTVQNDILKEFLVRNTFIYPPEASLRIVSDVISYTSKYMPKFNSISISGYHLQEAGASQCTELAFALANGREYVANAISAGLDIDSFAPRLSFFFGIGMEFYLEIAKLRAARTIWHDIMVSLGAKSDKSKILRTHCQTSGWSLAAQDPLNNIVRTTVEAMAAVFGGTQSLHTNSYDEAVSLPTEESSRIARNTQLILQEETKITKVSDPWAGSYMMETLTQEIVKKTLALLDEIDSLGGMVIAIKSGWAKSKIEETALTRQARIDSKSEVIVGVNKYTNVAVRKFDVLEIDAREVRQEQVKRIAILKNTRSISKVSEALQKLKLAAISNDSLLEACVLAAKSRATVGEMSAALEEIFGRYTPALSALQNNYVKEYKDVEKISRLCKRVSDLTKILGRKPSILIAKLGQDGHDRGAAVVASAFDSFGFVIKRTGLFKSPLDVAKFASINQVDVIAINSLVAAHKELIPETIEFIRKYEFDIPIVVGGVIPEQDHSFLFQSGVTAIYGPGTDLCNAADEIISYIARNSSL